MYAIIDTYFVGYAQSARTARQSLDLRREMPLSGIADVSPFLTWITRLGLQTRPSLGVDSESHEING